MADLQIIRAVFVAVLTIASYYIQPFGLERYQAAILGFAFSVAIITFEIRLKRASLKRLKS